MEQINAASSLASSSVPSSVFFLFTVPYLAAYWALRWVGSHNNVHVILSGMSAEEQLLSLIHI